MNGLIIHTEGLTLALAHIGALTQIGLIVSEYTLPESMGFGPIYIVFALFFLAGIRFVFFARIQAALFFALTVLQTIASQNCFFGLGFAVVAVLIVFQSCWFGQKTTKRAFFVAAIGDVLLISPIAVLNKNPLALAPAFICAAIFTILVFSMAKMRRVSELDSHKNLLRLADYDLTRRETQVVKTILLGAKTKDFAIEHGIAESTVRNALSGAYRKLGVACREELVVMCENYRVE
jgi:DNA-binding CsgD family transcriptional regulator